MVVGGPDEAARGIAVVAAAALHPIRLSGHHHVRAALARLPRVAHGVVFEDKEDGLIAKVSRLVQGQVVRRRGRAVVAPRVL